MKSRAAPGAEGQGAGDLVAMTGRDGRLEGPQTSEHAGGEGQVSHLSLPSWDFSEAEIHSSRSLEPGPQGSGVTSQYELTIHKKGGSFQGWGWAEVGQGLDQWCLLSIQTGGQSHSLRTRLLRCKFLTRLYWLCDSR